jgi:hypothetical protein
MNSMTERIACTECGVLILPTTARETGGVCMPCKGGYRKQIEEGRRRIEEERKRRDSPAGRFWRSLVHRVHETAEGFGGLTAAEQIYFAARVLEGEVYNGGFDQYFYNSAADYYARAVEGLIELGAAQSLTLLREAKSILFGSNPVPPTQTERIAVFPGMSDAHAAPPDWSERLDDVNRRFWEDPDRLGERLDRFAAKHGLSVES